MDRIAVGSLRIAAELHAFVEREAAPGSGLSSDAFWSGLGEVVAEFAPRNRALLAVRDAEPHAPRIGPEQLGEHGQIPVGQRLLVPVEGGPHLRDHLRPVELDRVVDPHAVAGREVSTTATAALSPAGSAAAAGAESSVSDVAVGRRVSRPKASRITPAKA